MFVNINRINSVLIENYMYKLIMYIIFWLIVYVYVNKKNKNSDFIENYYYMYY